MKYVQKIWIILLGIFLVNQNLNAQFGFQNQEILDFNVYQSFDKIQPEGEIKLAFKVSIFVLYAILSTEKYDVLKTLFCPFERPKVIKVKKIISTCFMVLFCIGADVRLCRVPSFYLYAYLCSRCSSYNFLSCLHT